MQFSALIEEWPGESMLFFRELPGCFVTAPTTNAAIQAAPATIEQYLRWLKANDLTIIEGDSNPITISIQEQLSSNGSSIGPIFESDRAEMNELEIDNALNVAATARALIIEVVANIPAQMLEQATGAGEWSLQQHLQHVMESENWYISRLQEDPKREALLSQLSADDMAMKIFEDAMDNEIILRELTLEQRTQAFEQAGETWTAAKVFRRQTSHLREHLLCMEAIENQLTARR